MKIAVGSDTMPTWNGATALMACDVAEFSGTVTLDQHGNALGTASPITVTASGTDTGTSRLVVAVRCFRAASAFTSTTNTDNFNSLGVGTGVNVINDDGATSQINHHRSTYCATATTGASADNDVMVWSGTSAHAGCVIASFYAPGIPILLASSLIARQARPRAATW